MQTRHRTKSLAWKRAISFAVGFGAMVVMGGGSATAQATSERFVVTGVIFVEGGGGLAWLQEPTFTKDKVIAVHPGDRVGPYRVAKILEDQVVLEGPNGTVSIPLAGGPGKATAAAGAGAQRPKTAEWSRATAANRPEQVIVVPPGDSRRNFPVTEFLGGNAPPAPTSKSSRGSQSPTASATPRGSSTSDAGPSMTPASVSSSSSASGSSGSSGGDPVVIPRGDSRRNFPVADFFPPPK